MKKIALFALLCSFLLVSVESFAHPSSYQTGETLVMNGPWEGNFAYPPAKVCANFPNATEVTERVVSMHGNNAIFLIRTQYQSGLMGYLVASTIPAGRTAIRDMEMALQRQTAITGLPGISSAKVESKFGATMETSMVNVKDGQDGPFPLERVLFAGDKIMNIAHSITFAMGADRVEVGFVGTTDVTQGDQKALAVTVRSLAKELANSAMDCTARSKGL